MNNKKRKIIEKIHFIITKKNKISIVFFDIIFIYIQNQHTEQKYVVFSCFKYLKYIQLFNINKFCFKSLIFVN